MDIFIHLFRASISLIGFIAVFLIFRYRTIDTYVDNRKAILRSLLENNIQSEPMIARRVQNIGKDPQIGEGEFFSKFNNKAVDEFVKDILEFRRQRTRIIRLGLISIIIWAGLSIFYLISSYFFGDTSSYAVIIPMSMVFFTASLTFTLYFIFYSLHVHVY